MSRSVWIYAALLVVGLGASWAHYTSEDAPAKADGVVLVESKKDALQRITLTQPELKVTFEVRKDDLGSYTWLVVEETKKGVTTTTRFKGGSAADKVVESYTPLMGMRSLDGLNDSQIEQFGLKDPTDRLEIVSGGQTATLQLGGETYGAKNRYVRDAGTGKYYILNKDAILPLRFAATRLPDRTLFGNKPEEIDSIRVGMGANTTEWSHKNKADTAAAFWERQSADGAKKDETFGNWLEKLLKLRSTAFVQESEKPADLVPKFDVIVRAAGGPEQTLRVYQAGADWYAESSFTRGLVKLTAGPASELSEEVDDVMEGRAPPPPPAPATPPQPPALKPGAPGMPGAAPGMPGAAPGMPGAAPGMPALPSGVSPGAPSMPVPGAAPAAPGKPAPK